MSKFVYFVSEYINSLVYIVVNGSFQDLTICLIDDFKVLQYFCISTLPHILRVDWVSENQIIVILVLILVVVLLMK